MQNQPATTDQVVFLGPRGEVLSARYPIRGDAGGLLAERADLSESGRLSAVVYLSPAPEWCTVQLALVEFYDERPENGANRRHLPRNRQLVQVL